MNHTKFLSIATSCLVSVLGVTMPQTGWAKSAGDTVKGWIEDSATALQKGVDKLGNDFEAIQDHLEHYSWKGIIEDTATSGPVTLKHLELNDHSRAVVVKPGERIEAEVKCNLDPDQCSIFGLYRIVVGIKGEGPQAVIGNEAGLVAGKTREQFVLIAPSKPGMYQIRFRPVDAVFKSTALNAWKDSEGNEPDAKTTIGVIIVKE
jgi:hypothetical protein